MQSNVDYRLLERFRAKRRLYGQPPPQLGRQNRVAAGADRRRPPAIDLRD